MGADNRCIAVFSKQTTGCFASLAGWRVAVGVAGCYLEPVSSSIASMVISVGAAAAMNSRLSPRP